MEFFEFLDCLPIKNNSKFTEIIKKSQGSLDPSLNKLYKFIYTELFLDNMIEPIFSHEYNNLIKELEMLSVF